MKSCWVEVSIFTREKSSTASNYSLLWYKISDTSSVRLKIFHFQILFTFFALIFSQLDCDVKISLSCAAVGGFEVDKWKIASDLCWFLVWRALRGFLYNFHENLSFCLLSLFLLVLTIHNPHRCHNLMLLSSFRALETVCLIEIQQPERWFNGIYVEDIVVIFMWTLPTTLKSRLKLPQVYSPNAFNQQWESSFNNTHFIICLHHYKIPLFNIW